MPLAEEHRGAAEAVCDTSSGNLIDIVRTLEVDEIVVAMDDQRRNFPIAELLQCRLKGVEHHRRRHLPGTRDRQGAPRSAQSPARSIFGEGFRRDTFRRVEERLFDVISSSLLPDRHQPGTAADGARSLAGERARSPVFYRQVRVGYAGRNLKSSSSVACGSTPRRTAPSRPRPTTIV